MSQEEVVPIPIAALSQRKRAFMQAVENSKKVEKTRVPMFLVEDALGEESYLGGSYSSMGGSHNFNYEPEDHHSKERDRNNNSSFSNSFSYSLRPNGFFMLPPEHPDDDVLGSTYRTMLTDLGLDPEKTQEVLKQEELAAKARFAALIAKFEAEVEHGVEPEVGHGAEDVIIESFKVVQKRYLQAVEQLRPAVFVPVRYEGPAKTAFENLKEDYAQEVTKREQFGDLQDRWDEYDAAQQDNRWYEWSITAQDLPDLPTRIKTESENNFDDVDVDEKEEQITTQWIDFTEMVVETAEKIKATSDDELSIDSDMSRWREEARRLKADAAVRKKRREAMLERKSKREEVAVKRHEEYVYKKGPVKGRSRLRANDSRGTQANSRLREEEAEGRRKQIDEANQKKDEDSTLNHEESSDANGEDSVSAKSLEPLKSKAETEGGKSPSTAPENGKNPNKSESTIENDDSDSEDDDSDSEDDDSDSEDDDTSADDKPLTTKETKKKVAPAALPQKEKNRKKLQLRKDVDSSMSESDDRSSEEESPKTTETKKKNSPTVLPQKDNWGGRRLFQRFLTGGASAKVKRASERFLFGGEASGAVKEASERLSNSFVKNEDTSSGMVSDAVKEASECLSDSFTKNDDTSSGILSGAVKEASECLCDSFTKNDDTSSEEESPKITMKKTSPTISPYQEKKNQINLQSNMEDSAKVDGDDDDDDNGTKNNKVKKKISIKNKDKNDSTMEDSVKFDGDDEDDNHDEDGTKNDEVKKKISNKDKDKKDSKMEDSTNFDGDDDRTKNDDDKKKHSKKDKGKKDSKMEDSAKVDRGDDDHDDDGTKNDKGKKKDSKKDKDKKDFKSKKKLREVKRSSSSKLNSSFGTLNASSSKLSASSTKLSLDGLDEKCYPCGDDDDMTDGPEEKNPRHLDGTLWKNLLKFWTNKPKNLNEVGAKYILKTLPRTDCFQRTERAGSDNASFYWFKAEGNFDVIVKIKGNFRSSYDKAGIMLWEDNKTWCLSGVEYFNGQLNHSTCLTRGISDWSLSRLPAGAEDGVWICVKRIEEKVECYFSLDVRKWVQTRQAFFSTAHTLKVGIAAACPLGEPFKVVFERFKMKYPK